MKLNKLIIIALALLMVVCAFAACGAPDETTAPDGTNSPDVTNAPDAEHVHNYVDAVIIAPTCNTIGKSVKWCSCGDMLAGSEMPVPLLEHDATEVNCTQDSVCKLCGTVLIEKFGHTFVETVVTEATCATGGEVSTKCVRCGAAGETKVVLPGHDFDASDIKVTKGDISALCTKCGTSSSLLSGESALKLDFDSVEELDALAGFEVEKPADIKFENGACQPNGALWIAYEPEFLTSMSKYAISFDFKLSEQGRTNGGDSIFSYCSKNPATYNWIVKFYQADGVLSTATSGFNSSNSVPATQGEWYNLIAVIDNSTGGKATVYINGVNIGTVGTINHASGRTDFRLRFGDIPNNAPSKPYFDNFKLIELK